MKNEKMNSNSQDETSAKLTKVLVSIYENILYPTGKCMITKTEQKLTVVRMLRMRLMCHKIQLNLNYFLRQRVTQKALQLPFFLFFVNNRRNFQIALKLFHKFAKITPPPQISFITCQFFWSFCQNNILSLYNNEMYYL